MYIWYIHIYSYGFDNFDFFKDWRTWVTKRKCKLLSPEVVWLVCLSGRVSHVASIKVRNSIGIPVSSKVASWKIHHLQMNLSFRPPFSSGIFQRPATFDDTGASQIALSNIAQLEFSPIFWGSDEVKPGGSGSIHVPRVLEMIEIPI